MSKTTEVKSGRDSLTIPLDPKDKAAIRKAAKRERMTMATWARRILMAAAGR